VEPELVDEEPPSGKATTPPKPILDLADFETETDGAAGAQEASPRAALEATSPVEPEEIQRAAPIPGPAVTEGKAEILDFGEAGEIDPTLEAPPARDAAEGRGEGRATIDAREEPGDAEIVPDTPPQPAVAGFWRRAVAAGVDALFLAALWSAVSIGLLVGWGVLATLRAELPALAADPAALLQVVGAAMAPHLALFALAQMVVIPGAVLYRPLCHAIWGKTLGKKVLGLRVVTSRGGRIGLGRAVARYLALMLSLAPFGLGCLWIAWDGRKQGWHDRLAGTIVIKERA
jgi:uncharacterized RDD family membrane protein YckC